VFFLKGANVIILIVQLGKEYGEKMGPGSLVGLLQGSASFVGARVF